MSNLVPDGWKLTSLDGKMDILSGFPFKSSLFVDDSSEIGLIRIRDIQKQKLKTYYSGEYNDTYIVKKGDVLIGMDGDFNITKWRIKDALLNQRICKVSAKETVGFDTDYLYHFLEPELLVINEQTVATTVKHLSVKDLRGITKAFPPLPEQQKIAKILTSVDEVIEKTQAQIDKLKDLKTGMMQELLTNGIGHTKFKDSAVGRIPAEWEVECFSDACSLIRDGTHLPPKRTPQGIPLLSVRNMKKGRFLLLDDDTFVSSEFYDKTHLKWKPQAGDLLLAVVGATIGKVAQVPEKFPIFTLQRSVAVIRGDSDKLDNDFLHFYAQSNAFNRRLWDRANQTAQPGIYLAEIGKILIPLPPLNEQKEIAKNISSVNVLIDTKESKVLTLQNTKKALIQDLLTGKVRVSLKDT